MTSAGTYTLRRRNVALSLAAVALLLGVVVVMFAGSKAPAVHADTPTIFLSTGVTNPGNAAGTTGEVDITGTGWAPAKHYSLYVYGQAKCAPNPICAPPATAKPINTTPIPINSSGTLQEFDFTFISTANITTYVFTVVADYPTDTPFSASALVQVVPAGTPTAVGTVSSAPSPTATVASPTQAAASPTAVQHGTGPGTGTTTTPSSGGGTTSVLIVIVSLLLVLMLGVLGVLLRTLPAKRRAIRAAYYGEEAARGRAYASAGQPAARRRSTGGYAPVREEPMPWQGGVASWDDNQRAPRGGSAGNPYSPPPPPRAAPRPPPRRPTGREDW